MIQEFKLQQEDFPFSAFNCCQKHPKVPIDFLRIDDTEENPLICFQCAKKKKLSCNQILSKKEIQESDSNTIWSYFPPLANQEVQDQFFEVSEISIDNTMNEINYFFHQFQEEIINGIKKSQEKLKSQTIELIQYHSQMIKKYNQISSKEEIKSVFRNGKDQSELNQKLKQIIKDKHSMKETNTKEFQSEIDQFRQKYNQISFTHPRKIKQVAIDLIESLDFFSSPSEKEFFNLIGASLLPEKDEKYIQKCIDNSNKLCDLISSKTNFVSQNFESNLREKFDSLSALLGSLNIEENSYDIQKRQIFQNLSDIQIDNLNKLANQMSKNSTNEFNNSNNYFNLISVNDIPTPYFIDNQEDIIKQSNYYDSQFYQKQTLPTINFEKVLEEAQNYNLQMQLKERKKGNITDLVYSYLENKVSTDEERISLKNILNDYPIFDLTNIEAEKSLIGSCTFIPAASITENYISVEKDNNLIFINSLNSKQCKIAYSDFILNPDTKYLIRLTMNRSGASNDIHSLFGLLPDKEKNSTLLSKQNMSYCEISNSYGMSKQIKGKKLHGGNKNQLHRTFEVRIHLASKLFMVADYPNYENVCALNDENQITDSTQYRFAMEFFYPNDSFILTEMSQVSNFNKCM